MILSGLTARRSAARRDRAVPRPAGNGCVSGL